MLSGYLEPSTINDWLEGFNADLANGRPTYFIRRGRLPEVLAAVQTLKAGSFA
jgi:hypothetical protein